MKIKFIAGAILAMSLGQAASAQIIVQGTGEAADCYLAVLAGDPGRAATISDCKDALREQMLAPKDKASTHVNIGILQMRAKDYQASLDSYNKAIDMRPKLSEAYINKAATLIYIGEHEAAIENANTALGLETDKEVEAYFNRAMAYDNLKQYNKAYYDLKQVLALEPDFPPALDAIKIYKVVSTS